MSFRTMQTPTSSKYSRMTTPPASINGSSTTFQQQKLNVVTRLALEGKTKRGWDGAAIKMYLKISLPLDSVSPGSSIPLFPEENVKIFDSQVHPIDNTSAPYSFSSTTCPLLNKAARALNLPARSPQSYLSLFGLSSPAASTSRYSPTTTNGANIAPLDEKYTGTILVSGYNVSFVLPKEFPSRFRDADSDMNGYSPRSATPSTYSSKRRNSVAEKNVLQFMAAIDMWVPYVCTPPKAPYLVSIPTPRCLSNHIKLRIFSPTSSTTANSYASLSSAEEDISSWDLTSDPHVTRTSSSRSRGTAYTDFADDESSDSTNAVTTGFADGCGIQGTFPSAERIRVRWAAPLKTGAVPEASDGRRRVGVRDVKGEMTCTILPKRKEGVLMKIDYKGTCKGVWFPGVATLLGMDVSLDAPDCKVSWLPGTEPKWSVSGSSGFTGFAVGPPPALSRRSSMADAPEVVVSPATSNKPNRHDSTSSTPSLLRTPLPAQSVPEYSFENSASSLSTATMSSLGSLGGRSRSPSMNGLDKNSDSTTRPPTVPITLHLNMNDLLPPSNNNFTFSVSGIVLISPYPKQSRESSVDSDDDLHDSEQPLLIPKFRVVYNDTETISTIVRSEVVDSIVEVYGPTGNIEDATTRRTVLHKGGIVKCGTEGGRIVLRPVAVTSLGRVKKDNHDIHSSRASSPSSRPRTPNGTTRYVSNSTLKQMASTLKPKRDGPLMIPSVIATVTPLVVDKAEFPNAYAVKVTLPVPSDADSEWLEFGLAQSGDVDRPPRVEIASASVEGIPVRFETTAAVKQENVSEGTIPFDQMSGKEWVSWVRVHVGELGGGKVEVVYLTKLKVQSAIPHNDKGKKKAVNEMDETMFKVLLPAFSLPVGQLEVNLESQYGFEITAVRSNLSHQQTLSNCRKLVHYSMEEYFYPRVTISITPASKHAETNLLNNTLSFITWTAPAIASVVLFFFVISLGTELRQMKSSLETCSAMNEAGWSESEPVTMTITTTIFRPPASPTSSSGSTKWWFAPNPSITPSPANPPDISYTPPTPVVTMPPTTQTPTSPASPQTDALTTLTDLFRWPLHFDIPPGHVTTELRRGLVILWQVLRKVYHYPLDPP